METDHISQEEWLRTIIEELEIDILFECFTALLLRSKKINPNNVHVIPTHGHTRNFANDLISEPRSFDNDPSNYFTENDHGLVIMYTSRSSILEYLPEDFYTEPDNSNEYQDENGNRRSKREIDAYRDKAKEQLESAHKFFRPLEVEYNKVRIQKELHELTCLEEFDSVLEKFWDQFPVINDRWRRFVRTLHLSPYVVGDLEKTKNLIEYVLDLPVTLSLGVEPATESSPEEMDGLMGTQKILGYNVVFGNVVYDYLDICTLQIENLATSDFLDYFLEDADGRKLVEAMIKHYFPLNVEVRLDFTINPAKENIEDEHPVAILGYSSRLE